jgi:alpha-1,6-mannosyltransferase
VSTRQTTVISCAGAASAAAWGVLCWISRHPHDLSLPLLFCILAVASAACLFVWKFYADELLTSRAMTVLFLWAIAFRLIGFIGAPVYEDDFYRYLWDGRTFALTGNPYDHAPSDSFGDETLPEKFQTILSRVNYPDIATIYGPVCEFSFLLAYYISPGELWPLKLLYLLADLATLWLIWRMAGNRSSLVLYAWSPLLIKEISFTAHTDILAAFFLMAGMERLRANRSLAGGLNLALAMSSRLFVAILIPLLLWRKRITAWIACSVGLIMLYLPFLVRGKSESATLGTFASSWEFNSLGFAVLKWAAGAETARWLWIVLFISIYAALFRYKKVGGNESLVLLVFFFLSPVVNPWYLVVMLPFVALRPTSWAVAATIAVLLSYITSGNLGQPSIAGFEHPWWVRPLEVLPVVCCALYGMRGRFIPQPKAVAAR